MTSRHITEILDAKNFDALASEELKQISVHAEICADCRKAFRAARMSAAVLKKAAENAPAPNAFFHAKVANARRERQIGDGAKFAFRRWWQASATMILAMISIAAILISVSAIAPRFYSAKIRTQTSNYKLYSTDAIILEQSASNDLTNEQALEALDDSAENSKKSVRQPQ